MILSLFLITFETVFALNLYRNLGLGDNGEDVRELQVFLNQDSETRLSDFGPGSPGNETSYFGPLTSSAVRRFQNLYKDDILQPLGLYEPTGFVGQSTRNKIDQLNYFDNTEESSVVENQNIPNTNFAGGVDQDYYERQHIERVLEIGVEQGYKSDKLNEIEEELNRLSEEGDYLEEFVSEVNRVSRRKNGPLAELLEPLTSAFSELLPDKAHAQAGTGLLDPFGGRVLNTFPCTCTGGLIWSVLVGPPKPVLADYAIGTQLYLTYNFPFYINALGQYTSTVTGTCLIYVGTACASVPSMGFITPIVGSSSI